WHVSKAKWGSRDENETLTLNMAQIRDPKKFLDKVKFLYSRPKERSRDELEFKDGRVFERYSAPLRDASGKYLGRVWYFHDISERKELEEFLTSFNNRLKEQVDERTRQLQEEKEKVEELARAKDNVIRDVSHELKTPLSVMIGNIALLKMPEIAKYPKKHADILDMLERNSVRLGESINQILNASRITTGNFKMQDFLLDDTIRDIVEEHAPLAKEKGLLLSAKCEGIELEGDQLLIGLAIKNLVSNAIKFTDNGKVSIKAWNSNDNVIIQVSDTGKGMSPEERKSLFVRFFKADRNAGGSGIGLVTSNEIIMKHKGKITVETKKGGGTAFTVILPRRQ
ncbi:MAG TPA: ATP-binding protein, partial [Candidatus Micrarchaeota archaeon]|nr:ATP-binding protein [Candidatus Micrarchaeota archaeon]